jgi:hypothetical protein
MTGERGKRSRQSEGEWGYLAIALSAVRRGFGDDDGPSTRPSRRWSDGGLVLDRS